MPVQSGRPPASDNLSMFSLAAGASAAGIEQGRFRTTPERLESPGGPWKAAIVACLFSALSLVACEARDTVDASPEAVASLELFAAASLQDVADDLAEAFGEQASVAVVLNTAGSNVLAQQIVATGRADLYISADRRWVDFLAERGRIVDGTQRDVWGNSLVVVARPDSPHRLRQLADLATLPLRHLAVADPEAVPAGRYARAYLQNVPWPPGDSERSLWQAVSERLVPTADVRAALALSASDPDILAVVYRTDALQATEVDILWHLPSLPEVPIAYRAAVVEGSGQEALALRFLAFLDTPTGREIIRRHGFDSL